jgi:hypothetical protein
VQIGLIALFQGGHLSSRNGVRNTSESLIKERLSAVTIGEIKKKIPAERLA